MNTQTITHNKKKYKVKFGIKQNIVLGKMWGLTKYSEIAAKLAQLQFADGEEPTMEQLNVLCDLYLSGIKSCNKKAAIDEDDVLEFIIENPEENAKLLQLYINAQPQTKAEKQKNVQPDQRK
ncbi:hypothetical protein [Candidatus Venteria ishoeyi]|uniref:Uncharacterized protein n=1 Tax=Candidatus Venteria ishoeyi TaxID=1899563 RepID=A0A1H6F7K0_9GAMM|nr:hypothetical protein [Candidatus Venteria ishoeyi]SEH05371.1 Uncharacterised protein [Candidatus Venteria ishoeyi]